MSIKLNILNFIYKYFFRNEKLNAPNCFQCDNINSCSYRWSLLDLHLIDKVNCDYYHFKKKITVKEKLIKELKK